MKEQFTGDMKSVSEKSDKEVSSRIEELRKEISVRDDEIRNSKDKISKLETYLSEEKSNVESLDKKLNNLQNNYNQIIKDKENIEIKLKEKLNELDSLQNEHKKNHDLFQNNNEQLLIKVKNLDNQIISLTNQQLQETNKYEENIKKLETQLEINKKNLNEKVEELTKLHEQLTNIEQELQTSKSNEQSLKNQVNNLTITIQNEQKDSSSKINKYENEINELQNNLENIRVEKNNKIHELEDNILNIQTQLSDIKQKYTNAETNVQKMNAEIEALNKQFKKEKHELEKQLELASSKDQKIIDACKALFIKFQGLRQEMDGIRHQKILELEKMNEFFPSFNQLLNKAFGFHQDMVDNLMQKYKRELTLRRKYFNIVQDLRGNIRVFCRVRPMLKDEIAQKLTSPFTFPNDGEVEVLDDKGNKQLFSYDRVYAPNTTQAQVSEDTVEYIQSVMDGYNVSIFAYGQTGSGKTYTMEGPIDNPGVNMNALKTLFQLAEERTPMFEYKIKVAIFEIYNENVRDLIAGLDKKNIMLKIIKKLKKKKKKNIKYYIYQMVV